MQRKRTILIITTIFKKYSPHVVSEDTPFVFLIKPPHPQYALTLVVVQLVQEVLIEEEPVSHVHHGVVLSLSLRDPVTSLVVVLEKRLKKPAQLQWNTQLQACFIDNKRKQLYIN